MKRVIAFFMAFCCFTLSGCKMLTDYTEPEQVTIVSALGFENQNNKLILYAETPITGNSAETKETRSTILSSFGNTADECIKRTESDVGNTLFLGHCAIIVLSETLTENQIKNILSFFTSLNNFPLAARIIGCDNTKSLLECKSISGELIGYDILRFLRNKEKQNSKYNTSLFIIQKQLKNENKSAIPCFSVHEKDGKKTYIVKENLWTIK